MSMRLRRHRRLRPVLVEDPEKDQLALIIEDPVNRIDRWFPSLWSMAMGS